MSVHESLAQQFGEEEMVFNDTPSTPAQRIVQGFLVFDDGSLLVCDSEGIKYITGPGVITFDTGAS